MNKKFSVLIKNKITKFNKTILVANDKSISHRALLIASQCIGPSNLKGVLESEDVKNTIICLKKLGVKILKKNKKYIVYGNGLRSFRKPHKNLLYVGNSGSLARMLIALVATHPNLKVKVSGDNSLNKRDMKRIIEPLSKIGCTFYPRDKTTAQKHTETLGSAQVKSAILLAAINTHGITTVEEKKISRNHTENLLTAIKASIKIKKIKKNNLISLRGQENLSNFNLEIHGDPSSAAPFIALTLLTAGSKLLIKNVNCNPTRIGFIKILKKMNANIRIKNLKKKSGEHVGNIFVKSGSLKPINCPKKLVSSAIDEFPLLFIIASVIKGVCKFSGINELRHKESDRIKNIEIGLNQIGIKTQSTIDSLKIFGNPNIKIEKTLEVYPKKDHRIAVSYVILGLLLEGRIKIHNCETINTSFPSFLKLIRKVGGKFEVK